MAMLNNQMVTRCNSVCWDMDGYMPERYACLDKQYANSSAYWISIDGKWDHEEGVKAPGFDLYQQVW